MAERLQKVLARAGLGSRRGCEVLIRSGRVTVNGRTATLGMSVDPAVDEIRVDAERLRNPERPVYVVLHKPVGVVCSVRSQVGRPTVCDLVNLPERLYPAGRLDVDSEGLVLLTNDGALALELTHPRFGHEKEYRVLLDRPPDAEQLKAWRRGVVLPDGARAMPAQVRLESGRTGPPWVRVIMKQGRKRQIRETAGILGLRVQRLVRIRIGDLHLGALKPGEWRQLSPDEVKRILPSASRSGGGRMTRSAGEDGPARSAPRARRTFRV